jgi:DNA-binding winged helix-turn-helix (wHTH) protein
MNAANLPDPTPADAERYRFDRFLLTPDRLSIDGRTVPLAAKPMHVLRTLAANAGRLTTKEALVATVWGDRAVSDESIARAVFLVRRALGDLESPPRFVETVYGRGYRFVADVTVDVVAPPAPSASRHLPPLVRTAAEREALGLCIDARFRLSKRAGNLLEAIALYERALQVAPEFQPARVGLAEGCLWLAMNGLLEPLTAAARARAQLRGALAHDPWDARAQATLGLLSSFFDWDVGAADAAFSLATASGRMDPVVHAMAARHRASLGDWTGARAALDVALAHETASVSLRNVRAFFAACGGDPAFGLAEIRTSIELEPTHPNPKFFYALIAAAAGETERAYGVARQLVPFADEAPVLRAVIGYAAARAGDARETRASLASVTAAARTRYVVPTAVAFVHVACGDADAAFGWLDRAIDERCAWLPLAGVVPQLAPLRKDPRFARVRDAARR